MARNSAGKIILSGGFYGTVDFDPGAATATFTSLGGEDIFFQEFDSVGNFYSARTMGGPLEARVINLHYGTGGKLYACGAWKDTLDLDPGSSTLNMYALGLFDAFTLQLGTCFNPPRTDSISACDSITWIDGNTYTSSNYSATYLQPSPNGCDSVIYLAYTQTVLDTGVTLNAGTLMSNDNISTYQWLVCSSNSAAIPNATSQFFTPSVAGMYAVVVSQNGCMDTSACVSVVTVGLVEDAALAAVTISPNPTAGWVKLHLGQMENVDLKVYNTLGKVVFSQNDIAGPDFQFDLGQAAGMYFVEVNGGGERRLLRLVVEK